MRKVLYSIITCACLCACNGVRKADPPKEQYTLGLFIDSCLESYPSYNNNAVTRSILADTLKNRLQKYRGKHLTYLDDLPFQYEMCLEYPKTFDFVDDANAGKYVVKFGFSDSFLKNELSDKYEYEATFQVFTVMDKEKVAMLVDDSLYHIKGIFRDFANNTKETGFALPSGKFFVDYPSVGVTSLGDTFICLGTLILDSLTFTKIQQ